MGFGLNVETKIDVPKIEVPKIDVASEINKTVEKASATVSGAADSVKNSVSNAVESMNNAVSGVVDTATTMVTTAVASLSSVAGAIADVAVGFTGAIDDIVLEPHISLDANASYGETNFEKGPIVIRLDMTLDEAQQSSDTVHLFSASGDYDVKKSIREFTEDIDGLVSMFFTDAPMDQAYTLEVLSNNGSSKKIISDITYGDLRSSRRRNL